VPIYCNHVLKQRLLPGIRGLNDDFLFYQNRALAHRSHHTVTSCVPMCRYHKMASK